MIFSCQPRTSAARLVAIKIKTKKKLSETSHNPSLSGSIRRKVKGNRNSLSFLIQLGRNLSIGVRCVDALCHSPVQRTFSYQLSLAAPASSAANRNPFIFIWNRFLNALFDRDNHRNLLIQIRYTYVSRVWIFKVH